VQIAGNTGRSPRARCWIASCLTSDALKRYARDMLTGILDASPRSSDKEDFAPKSEGAYDERTCKAELRDSQRQKSQGNSISGIRTDLGLRESDARVHAGHLRIQHIHPCTDAWTRARAQVVQEGDTCACSDVWTPSSQPARTRAYRRKFARARARLARAHHIADLLYV
jgi:hypothetical protein